MLKQKALSVFKALRLVALERLTPLPFPSALRAEILQLRHSAANVTSCVKRSQVPVLKQKCYFLLTAMTLSFSSITALSSASLNEMKTVTLLVWLRNTTESWVYYSFICKGKRTLWYSLCLVKKSCKHLYLYENGGYYLRKNLLHKFTDQNDRLLAIIRCFTEDIQQHTQKSRCLERLFC